MISVFFEFVTRILIWIFKNIFEMISFFMRQIFRLLRMFFVAFPVTALVYSAFLILLIVSLFAGDAFWASFPVQISSGVARTALVKVASDYLGLMSKYGGTMMYFVLLFLALILIIPIGFILIAASAFSFCGRFLIFALFADVAIYLFGSVITGRGIMGMATGRYKLLFPSAGHRIDQKNYNSWLRRHSREFEDDTFGQRQYDDSRDRRRRPEDFYDDEYEEEYEDDEDYDDEYEDDEDYDDEYDVDYYEDDEDAEYDDYDEDYDDYEDNYDDRVEDKSYNSHKQSHNRRATPKSEPVGTFNFFAGCTTKESADRKYKQLVKLYHPDNMDGDTSALQEINVQYDQIKKKFRA
ncbi:J domain-containing protein [Butyrivibrio sp. WCD3002]|uniref:J domain-containing protein n=1 Tax=Butyrivibrio sp. WCD3002 TaxID=1280676 RepID=UPI0004266594|nr:J domain-containing protein [Butyrivibrio sp. WCD3002]